MRRRQIVEQGNAVTRLTITVNRITLKLSEADKLRREQLVEFAMLIANEPEMVEPIYTMRGIIKVDAEILSVVMMTDVGGNHREYKLQNGALTKCLV